MSSAAKFEDFIRVSEEAEAAGIEFEVSSPELKQKIDKAAQGIMEEEGFEETLEKTGQGQEADEGYGQGGCAAGGLHGGAEVERWRFRLVL